VGVILLQCFTLSTAGVGQQLMMILLLPLLLLLLLLLLQVPGSADHHGGAGPYRGQAGSAQDRTILPQLVPGKEALGGLGGAFPWLLLV